MPQDSRHSPAAAAAAAASWKTPEAEISAGN